MRCSSHKPGNSKCRNGKHHCLIRSCLPLEVSELLRMRMKNSASVMATTAEVANVREEILPSRCLRLAQVNQVKTCPRFLRLHLHTHATLLSNVKAICMYLHMAAMAVNTHA